MKGHLLTWKKMDRIEYIKAMIFVFGRIYKGIRGNEVVWKYSKGLFHDKKFMRIARRGCYFFEGDSDELLNKYCECIPCDIDEFDLELITGKDRLTQLAKKRNIVVKGLEYV